VIVVVEPVSSVATPCWAEAEEDYQALLFCFLDFDTSQEP
jgi:hypothetical protein